MIRLLSVRLDPQVEAAFCPPDSLATPPKGGYIRLRKEAGMTRPFRQALLAITVSGAIVAGLILSVLLIISNDLGLSVGTAFTYVMPGCVQCALSLGIYLWLDRRNA